MNLLRQPMVIVALMAVVAIAAVIVGQAYKLAWVSDWLAPVVMLVFFIALSTLTTTPPQGVKSRRGRVGWFVRTALFAALIWLYVSIDIVAAAPVTMRLMGLSWTMSPHAAGRFLELTGLGIGAIAVGLTWMDRQRAAAKN